MINSARFLVETLEAYGVTRAYCVPGESYLPVLDAFVDSTIDLITCFHESSAGFMAVADGRVGGKPGICLVSRGRAPPTRRSRCTRRSRMPRR